nr:uncharacterized protein LOC109167354 [Ipomoea batatas]
MVDFIVECSAQADEPHPNEEPNNAELWEIQTNGASNNEVEYEVIIGGLRLIQALKATRVRIETDPRLVVNQLTNECETREERLRMYKDVSHVTEKLLGKLTTYEVVHVP